MYGVQFHDSYNNLIVMGADFSVTDKIKSERYKFGAGPDRIWLKKQKGNTWEEIPIKDEQDIVKILPEKFNWTWDKFLTALTYFAEGHK